MIYFTADQHFGHEKIIDYLDRPFKSIAHMNDEIIGRHNEVVGHDDNVYILGDFTLGDFETAKSYIVRLNGNLRFLSGSHDFRWFPKYTQTLAIDGRIIRFFPPLHTLLVDRKEIGMEGEYPLVIALCHYAMRRWDRSHYDSLHLFGHSHCRLSNPAFRSMDIGVDCNNYYPFSLDDVLDLLIQGEKHVKQSFDSK